MALSDQWQWQTPQTSWKGIGIYHVTLTVTSRQPLLGELVIPDGNPDEAKVDLTPLVILSKTISAQGFDAWTRRTEYPLYRLLLFCGFTLPELKFKLYAFVALLAEEDQ